MSDFNPNAQASKDSGIFGLPYTQDEAKLILIPVPWEATTSYGGGTSQAPQAIFDASKQIDLFDLELGNFFEAGIMMLPISEQLLEWNKAARAEALNVIKHIGETSQDLDKSTEMVNAYSQKLNASVYEQSKKMLEENKVVGLIGGDHASVFGSIKAHTEKYPNLSILHFDAHADLRNAYEGFTYSHASIMFNVMQETPLKRLVQVGIRDFCEEEFDLIQQNSSRVKTYFDAHLSAQKLQGMAWSQIIENIVNDLSDEVYVSFDIDGLDPRFCPHTGTPVPGGLDFNEAIYLLKAVVKSGRKIVGFDLNEVSLGEDAQANGLDSASEWDANVGARLLYKLCGFALYP